MSAAKDDGLPFDLFRTPPRLRGRICSTVLADRTRWNLTPSLCPVPSFLTLMRRLAVIHTSIYLGGLESEPHVDFYQVETH